MDIPISTPEKPTERSVAFSVMQVRRAAAEVNPDLKLKSCVTDSAGSIPEKPISGSERKLSISCTSIKLPEEYEKLEELFNSMVRIIRLMRLKRHICTFSNVSPKIESLTNRRFTHGHLARMKFVFSEAISLKKVLCHKEATSCMEPDIQISILTDALGSRTNQKEGGYPTLEKIFHARLVEYFREHPGADKIPEANLPEPFSRTKSCMRKSSPSCQKEEEKETECSGFGVKNSSTLHYTPSKVVSTPIRLMTATPELQTSKRIWQNEDDCMPPVRKSVKRPLSLDEQVELDDVPSTLRFLPKDLLLSVKEQDTKANKEREANISQFKRRRKMISCLPKLFDTIHYIFQTSAQSVITRKQLIYKIISGNLDVVDKSEIEEQLSLLQELAPDWISERATSIGDTIFSVGKFVTPESVRKVLKEAK